MKLTTGAIENARYEGRSYLTKKGRKTWSKHIIWDDDFDGLGLRVFPTKRKTFVLSYRDKGRKRMKTLGEFGPLTLDEARQQATEFLESIGQAPTLENVPAAAQAGGLATFADLTQAYVEQQLKTRGTGAFAQQRLIRLHITPVLGHVPLSQVRPADLWRLRAQVAKRYPSDAGRLSNLVRVMFKWASDQGLWQAQAQADASEDSSFEPHETGPIARFEEAVDDAETAAEAPVLAVSDNNEENEEEDKEEESLDELRAARDQIELDLQQAKHELDGVRRHAATEAQALREESADAENRVSTLSLSVQQLQEALRDAESEHERLTREIEEADEKHRDLSQEIHTLDSARRAQAVELDRVRAQLESRQEQPPPRSEEAAATTALPSQRPSVPWLAGALVLGAILGGALVSFFGFLGTPPAGSSHESQVATARPSGPASGAGKPTTEALPAEHLGTPDAFASEPAGSEGPSENATPGGDDPEAASLPAEAAVASDAGTSPAHLEPAADSGPMPDSAAVEAIVRAWATAWADQHVEAYLDSYSRSFIPPDGMTRADWEAQRRTRILRPDWIRLSLGPITSTVLEGGTIHADFDQTYATPTYSDEVRKNLVLTREDGGWKIAEERSE